MPPNYVLFRQALGILFALDALHFVVHPRLWLGRGFDERRTWLSSDLGVAIVLIAWLTACIGLVAGYGTLTASLVLFVLFRHFYIGSRWRSLLRGVGAVGFMPYWATAYLALFELVARTSTAAKLGVDLHRMMRFDFAAIFVCAGLYKSLTGYTRGEGIEYAMSNPMWSYGFGLFRRIDPHSSLLRLANATISTSQVLIGFLIAIPQTQMIGAVWSAVTFISLSVLFRIGRLGFVMAAIALLFVPELNLAHPASVPTELLALPAWVVTALTALTYAYVGLLVIVKVVQYVNLFLDRSLPRPLQGALNRYAGWIPIIIWRVFSVDITNFFVRIFEVTERGERALVTEETVYSPWSWSMLWFKIRYLHVGESVALAALFNVQKHFASQPQMFKDRILRYARTVSRNTLRFEYVLIRKQAGRIDYVPLVNYRVDGTTGQITEERLAGDATPATTAQYSPIRESVGFGSYVKKS